MPEDARSLIREVHEQTMSSARDFFGNSVGSLKNRLEKDRSQLQTLLDHLPESQEDIRPQLQQLLGSYEDIEYMMVRAIQKQKVEETAKAVQPREVTEHLPPDNTLLGETTDEQGRTVLRSIDGSGVIMETKLGESGVPVGEEIVGTADELPAEKKFTSENGDPVLIVEDESGRYISLTLDEEGETLNLEVLDGAEC
ncbi:MAG: hypothetical protein WA990_01115 [Rubrobacteraceae bacterium]